MERQSTNDMQAVSSSYLTPQDLIEPARGQENQSRISSRLSQDYRILVERQEVQQEKPQQSNIVNHSMKRKASALPQTHLDQNVFNRLRGNSNPAVAQGVKSKIQEAYSDIDFNNFDIAYSKISQAIKMLEGSV